MKNKLFLALTLCALCFGGKTEAQNYTNLVTQQTVNGTVTGGSVLINLSVPSQTFLLLSGTITNAPTYTTNVVTGVTNIFNNALTNILYANWYSLDGGATKVFWRTNYPNNTNGTPTTAVLSGSIPVSFGASIITPNPLPAGVLKQN